MLKKYPFVSVIIPVYNAEEYIYNCLKHITDQNYPHKRYEVVVVDNASSDGSAGIIKTFNVIYHYSKEKGPSPSRNAGIQIAKGEYMLFIDADCLADKNLIAQHVKSHLAFKKKDPAVKLVGGGIGGINKSFWATCDDFCSWYLNSPGLEARYEKRYLPTANLSVSKDVLNELNGFDLSLRFGEDVDFCTRARTKGYKIYFEPGAKLLHVNRTSFRSFINHAKQWAHVGSTTELTNTNNEKIEVNNKVLLGIHYLYYFAYRFFELVISWIRVKRYTVFLFLPFILLNKIIFAYYMVKHRLQAKTGKKTLKIELVD